MVAEAEAEADDAWHQADLKQLEADTAVNIMVRAETSLLAAKEDGELGAITIAEQVLADAKASAKIQRQEAELATAKATTMQARMHAKVEEAEARIEEKEAQDAEIAMVSAKTRLEDAITEGPGRRMSEQRKLEEALKEAKSAAVRTRNEATIAEADAELARSELDANEAAACALKENSELQVAEKMVADAEAALATALEQEDEEFCSQAKKDLAKANAALEKQEGETQVADAIAAVARAEVVADKAAARALGEQLQAQAAEDFVKQAHAALAASQLEANTSDIQKATEALDDARAAAEKERSEADDASTKAAEAGVLAAHTTEAAMAVLDQVEARAAENASVSMTANKHLRWYRLGAGLILVMTIFFVGLGAWFGIYTLAGRVIDNDKMMVIAVCYLRSTQLYVCFVC